MLEAVLAVAVALAPVPAPAGGAESALANPKIDDTRFLQVTAEAIAARAERRLPEAEFARLALRPGSVVLDARSRSAYDQLHVRGARSLPFTDFTAESLARVVPAFDTPILIYCNNNFDGAESEFATKAPPAALNLSTFAALRAYGYANVWELGPLLDIRETRLELAGRNAANYRHSRR